MAQKSQHDSKRILAYTGNLLLSMIAHSAKSHRGRFGMKIKSMAWTHLAPFSLSHLQQQRPWDKSISLSFAYALAMFLIQRFSSCRMASCMAAMRRSASWDSSESLVSPLPCPVVFSVCFVVVVEEGGRPSPFFAAKLSAAFCAFLALFFWILRFYCLRLDLSLARFAAIATAWSRFWATGLWSSISSSISSSFYFPIFCVCCSCYWF